MSPANRPTSVSLLPVEAATRELKAIADAHQDWFISCNGSVPLEINRGEFDFSLAHGRLLFASWTEQGSRTWHVTAWHRSHEKLVLQAARRMGAEIAAIELVPRASAQALVASITAARQARCACLAEVVAEGLQQRTPHQRLTIERASLSPGRRRDQPGRYARIILRLPHERIAVTGIVAL